jgi:hypothetical protein
MKNPVVAADGFMYEKECIEKWLKKSDKSPITNMKLSSKKLHSVHIFNKMLKKYKEINSICDLSYDNLINEKRIDMIKHWNIGEIYCMICDLHKNYSQNNKKMFIEIFENDTLIDYLIDNKNEDNINDRDKNDMTLLYYICRYGNLNQLEKIINIKNIDLEMEYDLEQRALFYICSSETRLKDQEVINAIKLFIQHGVNLEEKNYSNMLLMEIILSVGDTNLTDKYQLEAIELLIDNGIVIKPSIRESHGLLHSLCSQENSDCDYHLKIVKKFIDIGYDPNAPYSDKGLKNRPLHFVCEDSFSNKSFRLRVIKLLVDNGADLEIEDYMGYRPIHLLIDHACEYKNMDDCDVLYDILKLLKDLGCNMESKINDENQYTPLTLFQKNLESGYYTISDEQKNKIVLLLTTKL